MKNDYKIYEIRFQYVNFTIIVNNNIIVMSPNVSGFIGMEFKNLQEKIQKLNGTINYINFKKV